MASPPRKLLAPPSVLDLKTFYQTLPFEFRLTRVEKAVASRIMLSIDPLGKNVVKTQVINPSEAFRLDRLEDGAYYCQASSIDSDGLEGLPSKAAAFRIRVNPLPPFIQKPLEGEEFRKKTVALE